MEAIHLETIPNFFARQDVFVTGATGFVGKVLVEKLLRSCVNIGNIYILIRPRRGLSPEDRAKDYTKNVIFDRLRQEHPEALSKLRTIQGNVAEIGLGLSSEDRQILKEHVSIVFHMAASVRFDDSLVKAVLCNTRGTREMVNLALEMDQLKVFAHVSTAFSNADRLSIEEKLYDSPLDWRAMIAAAETLDPLSLNILAQKLIGKKANTYVFSKSLAEQVINDYKHQLPAFIIRPSVVVSTLDEPFPGYTDNYNGPVGMILAILTGVMQVALVDGDVAIDHIPADVTAKATIVAAWWRVRLGSSQLPVYNCCSQGSVYQVTFNDITEYCTSIALRSQVSFPGIIPPTMLLTKSRFLFFAIFYLLQLPIAVTSDIVLFISRKKTRFMKTQRRLIKALLISKIFTHTNWNLSTKNFMNLEGTLQPSDEEQFRFKLREVDVYTFFINATKGCKRFLLKEKVTMQETAKTTEYGVHILNCLLCSLLVYWTCSMYSLPQKIMSLVQKITDFILTVGQPY